ncbi:MAG TPA: FAD-binding oxidoreductase [Rariglobus sp.]|nr:FAD-binding oxidoreductase [Rariglobus sp.]
MRVKKLLVSLLLLVLALVVGPPALFLSKVWWNDRAPPRPSVSPGTNDASRMNNNTPAEVIRMEPDPADAEKQLSALLKRATEQHLRISISGAKHSMGGHTLYPGGIALNMDPFNRMSLDEQSRILRVGAGARWSEIIPFLDRHGLAVAVMQSNNDFSVGGSISVNCHGWQHDSPPISSTVDSFRLLTPAGAVVRCSRTENTELFSLALGGYGLFGVILEVDLRVVPNEFYKAEAHDVKTVDYARTYRELIKTRTDVGLAYGRINVAPDGFMEDAIITLLKREPSGRPVSDTLKDGKPSLLKRLVFLGGIGSDYGKNLRWFLEKSIGQNGATVLSRNQIMNQPSDAYATRDPGSTDILHEYFIPGERLADFIGQSRAVLQKHRPELLNITVRNVERDDDTFLRYATGNVFGLVMLFHQRRDDASEKAMQALTRDLTDAALACEGRHYLTYRAHASREQFAKAYPQAREFFALKDRYDPSGIFQNTFLLNYGNRSSP